MKLLLFTIRGLGQIMLQRSAATGALFAVGLAVNSLTMALAAFLGSFAGTVMAFIGRFPSNEIEDGLYGFNGALVAIAAMYFYSFSKVGFFVGVVGVICATLLMRVMQKYSLMPFTFPFVATIWAAFLLVPKLYVMSSNAMTTEIALVDGFFQAFGQVMFQANSLTGIVFFVAILVNSRKSAGFAALGTVFGVVVSWAFKWPMDQVTAGLYGYNAILTAIAVTLISQRIIILSALGALLSIAVTKAMLITGIPALHFRSFSRPG